MSIDIVRGELERLFSLDEMMALASDLLGFEPDDVGGTASKASFARALTDRCIERDATLALVDAVLASRLEVDPRLREVGPRSLSASDELKAGDKLGPFTVLRKIADGPRGTVYGAKRDGAERVLKVIHRGSSRDATMRFLTFTRLASRVDHENLPESLESGMEGGRAYVAYAAMDGQPLSARIARTGPLHINEAKNILRGILGALGALHRYRLSHGALKLENVLIGRSPEGQLRPIVVDAGSDRLGPGVPANGSAGGAWGNVAGVRGASPEQLRGKPEGERSDLYAFGALLFELLTGKPPFAAESGVDLAIAHLTQPPPAPSTVAPRGWVTKDLDELCLRLLDKLPSARPKDVAAVLETLEPLGRPAREKKTVPDEELGAAIDKLLADPSDSQAALGLESLIEQGADPAKVAEAFIEAAERVVARAEAIDETAKPKKAGATKAGKKKKKKKAPEAGAAKAEAKEGEASGAGGEEKKADAAGSGDGAPGAGPGEEHKAEGDEGGEDDEASGAAAGAGDEAAEAPAAAAETKGVSLAVAKEVRKTLLFRAARIYDGAKVPEKAEAVYAKVLALDPGDDIAFSALEDLRRTLGKHEELIEMLLERSESSESHSERARALNQIGHLYWRELDDHDQAVFALAQALAQDAQQDEYAVDLERAAGENMKLWSEALNILSQVTTRPEVPVEAKVTLFTRLGRWYSEKVARPDLGLPCFQAVLSLDPAHDGALEGLSHVLRRAQQWQELAQVLQQRADRAPTPEKARDLRADAADVLETRLNEPARARDLFEQIFEEDPWHAEAADALARIYQRVEDWAGYAKILERRAMALRGEERAETLCRIAELYEDHLNDLGEATRRFETVLDMDPQNLTALRGLDRIYNRTGRYKDLLGNLEKQIAVAVTPRQKINLYQRLAGIYEEEFLDHAKAAEAHEAILGIDGAYEASLASLVRHYRALDRWEDVVRLYDKHLKIVTEDARRVELLVASGRVLLDQIGSPERARHAYERVLEIDPSHAGALEALAQVRAATGDALAALSAVESLAGKAATPESKADLWIRAAKILEDRGDRDGAIERYKAALDALPGNPVATTALRGAYLARGDATSAVELITRSIETAEGNLAKARLYGEMAQLLRERLKDDDRAREAAKKAVSLDPTSIAGLMILGDLAFEAGRFLEASKSYESLANRVDALPKQDGVRLLFRYIDALSKSGSTEKALGCVKTLLALSSDDPEALARAARVTFAAGKAQDAAQLYGDLVARFGEELGSAERADALLHLGLSRLQADKLDDAVQPLLDAADLEPDSAAPLSALCKVYEAKKDWEEVVRIKNRRLDVVTGEERSVLLLEIGEVLAAQIGDRTRAAKSYVAALDERPDDRRILTKLMQLYSEEKDWSKLVEVVLRLAAGVTDQKQKAKYLHTAAIVTARHLGDMDRAAELFDEVLELDPTLEKALAEAVDIRTDKGELEAVERLLKMQLDLGTQQNDVQKMLRAFEKLAVLYKDRLGWTSEAIDAYEAAQTLEPDNVERAEVLAQLYASDPVQYLDKAVAAQVPILRRSPYKPEPYRLLRKLYTEGKRADAAWCLCQALFCMNFAEPDEERFFRRMRSDSAAAAQDRLADEHWAAHVMHADADPLLTAIFAIISPAVFRKNGQPLEALGYQLAYALDLSMHPYPMSQTLNYACGVLGMDAPLAFQNPNDPGGVSFLHAQTPAVVLGAAALVSEIPQQAAAFIAARHLTYYRPGLYLRHLVPTGTGLRAWLFAAIKLIVPAFPVAKELEGPVKTNLEAIDPVLTGAARDQLASAVTKLLQAGSIDLKKWVAGVDLSADRAGFILANDLELSQEMIKAADEGAAAVQQRDRLKELVLYSVSEDYFAIRQQLGITLDS